MIFFCVSESKVTVFLMIVFHASHYLFVLFIPSIIFMFFFQVSGVIDKGTVSLYYLQLKVSHHSIIVLDKAATNFFYSISM